MLSLISNDKGIQPEQPGYQALLTLTFIALFLNCSTTVTSLILIDKFGELPYRDAPSAPNAEGTTPAFKWLGVPKPTNGFVALTESGKDKCLIFFLYHCEC